MKNCKININKKKQKKLQQKLIGKGYKSDLVDNDKSTVSKLDRNKVLKEKVMEKPDKYSTKIDLQSLLSKHQ